MQFPGCDSQYTTGSIILFASATTDTIYEKETYPAVVYVELLAVLPIPMWISVSLDSKVHGTNKGPTWGRQDQWTLPYGEVLFFRLIIKPVNDRQENMPMLPWTFASKSVFM